MSEVGERSAHSGFRTRPHYWPRYPHTPGARPSLLALEALRGTSGSATMTTPGGASTTLRNALSHAPCSVHRLLSWGRSFLVYLAPALLRFAPSRCPKPSLARTRVAD